MNAIEKGISLNLRFFFANLSVFEIVPKLAFAFKTIAFISNVSSPDADLKAIIKATYLQYRPHLSLINDIRIDIATPSMHIFTQNFATRN